jgi:hypothetical protein
MKVALEFLEGGMRYEVPKQDLSYRLSRIPAIPKSRFVMKRIVPIREKPMIEETAPLRNQGD